MKSNDNNLLTTNSNQASLPSPQRQKNSFSTRIRNQGIVFRIFGNYGWNRLPFASSPIRVAESFSSLSRMNRNKERKRRRWLSIVWLTCLIAAVLQILFMTQYHKLEYQAKTSSSAFDTFASQQPIFVPSASDKSSISSTIFPPRVFFYFDQVPRQLQEKRNSTMIEVLSSGAASVKQIYHVPYVQGNCTPIASWQVDSRPNCNSIHEVDLAEFTFVNAAVVYHSRTPHLPNKTEGSVAYLGQGWFRMAWKLHTGLSTATPKPQQEKEEEVYSNYQDVIETNFHHALSPPVILKTLRFERDFLDEYYDLHRRDAMAMERLTFSPFVLNVYGYCGQSAMNEIAVDNVEKVFSVRSYRFDNAFRLQTCLAVAKAVAHVHTGELVDTMAISTGRNQTKMQPAALVHYDLNPRNVAIMADGTPKLNDFNVAEFLRWDNYTKTPCGFTGRFWEPWWRAPEEMATSDKEKAEKYQLIYDPNSTALTEKVDVYSRKPILLLLQPSHLIFCVL